MLGRAAADGELIAADARERVLRPEMALQAAGDRQQQAVADDEPERGVDALELVDVDAEHARAGRLSFAFARITAIAQAVEEQLAVGQARQAVVHGVVQQPLVRALGVRHVAHQADAAHSAACPEFGTLAASSSNQR